LSFETAFWDSSVLAPLCVDEPTSRWAGSQALRFRQAVWWAASVEVRSAIERERHRGFLKAPAAAKALSLLASLEREWQDVVPSDEVRDLAKAALAAYPLRAADALQLAAALVWCRERPKGRNFLCADARLGDAAEQAGFTVLRP
jgi:predicted nucleic acid-binding protein